MKRLCILLAAASLTSITFAAFAQSKKLCPNNCWQKYHSCMGFFATTEKPSCESNRKICLSKCSSSSASGYYVGFHNASSAKDREKELKQRTGGFIRVNSKAGDFDGLCKSIGSDCKHVKDWEGTIKSCTENGRDGSRVAFCSN